MDGATKPDIAELIAGALEWWRDAGVDSDFADEPHDWLAREAPPEPAAAAFAPLASPPTPAETRATIGGPAESWPQDLASFQAWWLTEPTLDHGAVTRRVPPRGPREAELMVLIADPEDSDTEALLSGPQGKLLSGILGALGLDRDRTYFASALPRATPLPDWHQLAAEGLGDLVRHHIALVSPRRVLAFGTNVSSLMGHDPAKNPPILPGINHGGRTWPLLAAMDLAALLARPRAKAGLWQRLLDWTGTTDT